jgi:lysozyme family protein
MASFNTFMPLLSMLEGGYQKMPTDRGNYNSLNQLVGTNHGISAPVYETWIGRVPTENDMLNLPKTTAQAIYKKLYWDKLKAGSMNTQEVAHVIVDHGVNAGTGSAAKIVQRILNSEFDKNVAVDGAIGNQTLTAINSVNQVKLQSAIVIAREQYYKNLSSQYPEFIQGWLNRLKPFYEDSVNLALKYKKPIGFSLLGISGAAALLFFLIKKSKK